MKVAVTSPRSCWKHCYSSDAEFCAPTLRCSTSLKKVDPDLTPHPVVSGNQTVPSRHRSFYCWITLQQTQSSLFSSYSAEVEGLILFMQPMEIISYGQTAKWKKIHHFVCVFLLKFVFFFDDDDDEEERKICKENIRQTAGFLNMHINVGARYQSRWILTSF